MEDYAVKYLEEHQILNSTESLNAYFDVTLMLDGSEAEILTTERVIYYKGGASTVVPLSEITDVRHRNEPLVGYVIEIYSRSDLPMKIETPPLSAAETFINALQDARDKLE